MKTKEAKVCVAGFTNCFVMVTGNIYQKGDILEEYNVLLCLLEKYLKREKNRVRNSLTEMSLLSGMLYCADC